MSRAHPLSPRLHVSVTTDDLWNTTFRALPTDEEYMPGRGASLPSSSVSPVESAQGSPDPPLLLTTGTWSVLEEEEPKLSLAQRRSSAALPSATWVMVFEFAFCSSR